MQKKHFWARYAKKKHFWARYRRPTIAPERTMAANNVDDAHMAVLDGDFNGLGVRGVWVGCGVGVAGELGGCGRRVGDLLSSFALAVRPRASVRPAAATTTQQEQTGDASIL